MAQGRYPFVDGSAAVLTSATTLLAANPARNFLYIENIGTIAVWVNMAGGTPGIASLGSCLLVPSGSTGVSKIQMETTVPANAITAIATATGAAVTVYSTVVP